MLTVAGVIEKARRSTGLHDLGEESYREGLEVVVKAANSDSRLNDLGWAMLEGKIVMLLSNRLKIEHWYAKHPEIDEQEIIAPLIGLGLPRTGSTALVCNLAEDPGMRSLRMWESYSPCPPPETATESQDPRIEQMRALMTQVDELYPRMKMMVPFSPTVIAEDLNLMGLDFKTPDLQTAGRFPDYAEWLLYKADLVPTYRYMKRALKLLQWRCPRNRWQLKSPTHLPFIDALNETFPDAKFWMTHRDITKVMPSLVDVYHEMLKPVMAEVDAKYIIDVNMTFYTTGMQRTLAFRDKGHEDRFIDVQFSEFQRDPESSIARIYEFLGEEFTPEARRKMADWRRHSAKDKHGTNQYDAIASSLDLNEVRSQFQFYTDRFLQKTPS